MRVVFRCRPLSDGEREAGAKVVVQGKGDCVLVTNPSNGELHTFTANMVNYMDAQQISLFREVGLPMVEGAMNNTDGTLFVWGSAGSGKSYTMLGSREDPGLAIQVGRELFRRSEESSTSTKRTLVSVSYVELSHDSVVDLLNPSGASLSVGEHDDLGVFVEAVAELLVRDRDDVETFVTQGKKVQQSGMLTRTPKESRCTVLTFHVLQALQGSDSGSGKTTCCQLQLVEFPSDTGSSSVFDGVRRVMTRQAQHSASSKIKQLLGNSLAGDTTATAIVTISPCDTDFDMTIRSLLLAQDAQKGTNQPRRRTKPIEQVIVQLRKEIDTVRDRLSASSPPDELSLRKMETLIRDLGQAKRQMREEKERLSNQYQTERQKNLAKQGMMDLVLSAHSKESEGPGSAEKGIVVAEYKHQKICVAELKSKLEQDIAHYSKNLDKDGVDDAQKKVHLKKIDAQKKALRDEIGKLRVAKKKVKDIVDQSTVQESGAAKYTLFVDDEVELMRAEKEAARHHVLEAAKEHVKAETRKLAEQTRQEKESLKAKVEQRLRQNPHVSAEELLHLEEMLLEEKMEKKHMQLQIELLRKENTRLGSDLEEETIHLQEALERQRQQHLEVFRRYREYFEEQKRTMEKRYIEMTEEAISDVVYYAQQARH